MTRPDEGSGFATRLDWLLNNVARTPGTEARYSTENLVEALTHVSSGADPARQASQWLSAMKAQRADPTDLRSRRYIAVLEDVFRLPPGYFLDAQVRAATDDRIFFAASVVTVRVIGPCRMLASELPVEDLHRIHARVAEVLNRHRPAS
jgi:hypothetical protein